MPYSNEKGLTRVKYWWTSEVTVLCGLSAKYISISLLVPNKLFWFAYQSSPIYRYMSTLQWRASLINTELFRVVIMRKKMPVKAYRPVSAYGRF